MAAAQRRLPTDAEALITWLQGLGALGVVNK
jgi:hypothetical protein